VTAAAAALALAGCGGTVYELRPAPHAAAPGVPLTAEVRSVESGPNGGVAWRVIVELAVHNGDPARAFSTGPPRLTTRGAWSGPPVELELTEERPTPEESLDRSTFWESGASASGPRAPLPPGATRTRRVVFELHDDVPPGPTRMVLTVPVDGGSPIELVLADVAGGSRWRTTRPPTGGYVRSGVAFVGADNGFTAIEPIGLAARFSFGRLVLSLDYRYTFLQRPPAPTPGDSFGLSGIVGLSWQPWTWHFAPYAEGGAFAGTGRASSAADQSQTSFAPRVSGGVMGFFGPRLGDEAKVAVDRPLSPQRRLGVRVGYTRWFHTGLAQRSDGVEMSLETGF
jgi:hypothetical protein